MINQSSLTDEQIKQMLAERGLSTKDVEDPQISGGQELSDEQIKQMMAQRGLSTAQPPGLLQQFGTQALKLPGQIAGEVAQDPLQAILNLGGATGRALFSPVAGLESLAGKGLGLLGIPGGETLQRMGEAGLGKAPGFKPELTPTISQIPGAALLASQVPSGIAAARAVPGLARGAAGLLGRGAEAIPGVRQLFGRAVPKAQREYEQHGANMLADYHDTPNYGEHIGEEEQAIANVLHKHNDITATKAKNLYDEIKPKEWGTKISKPNALKFVTEVKKVGKGNLGDIVTEHLNTFLKNPTAKNAHEAQSVLGEHISDLYMRDVRPPNNELKKLQSLRSELRNNIGKVAGNRYKKASDYYRDNRVAYKEDQVVSNVIKGKVPSGESLARRMAKGETLSGEEPISTNALKTFARHMDSEDKEKMILPFIKGTKSNPVLTVSGKLNPDVIRKGMEGLKVQGLEKFMSKDMYKDLGKLNKLAENIEKQKRRTKAVRYGVPATAALFGVPTALKHSIGE